MPKKVSILEKINEDVNSTSEKKKVGRKKSTAKANKDSLINTVPDKDKDEGDCEANPSKSDTKENIVETPPRTNADTNDINLLLNPPSHDLSKEKDIYIDMSKILKYTPLTIEGKSLDDVHSVLYAVPYGPNNSDYDILTYSELQAMINAQIVENNVKINRKYLRTIEGRDKMSCSQDLITRHKLHAWTLLSSRENA
jgi:hypothetical protein